jgi:hypothetical protein
MKSITLISLVALGSLALYGNAYAEKVKTYSGSYCGAYFGSQAGDFNHQFNGIMNLAASPRYISCPVIEDSIFHTNGTTKAQLHYTGTGTVSCVLSSNHPNGSSLETKIGMRTNTGWFTIPGISADDYWGAYSMYCQLPSKGVLNTIWFGEKDNDQGT